jgi:hypothetical protein
MNRGVSAESPSVSRRRLINGVQPVVEVDERIPSPQALRELLARNELAGACQQQDQYLKGLFLKTEPDACLAQLSRPSIQLEVAKADETGHRRRNV